MKGGIWNKGKEKADRLHIPRRDSSAFGESGRVPRGMIRVELGFGTGWGLWGEGALWRKGYD